MNIFLKKELYPWCKNLKQICWFCSHERRVLFSQSLWWVQIDEQRCCVSGGPWPLHWNPADHMEPCSRLHHGQGGSGNTASWLLPFCSLRPQNRKEWSCNSDLCVWRNIKKTLKKEQINLEKKNACAPPKNPNPPKKFPTKPNTQTNKKSQVHLTHKQRNRLNLHSLDSARGVDSPGMKLQEVHKSKNLGGPGVEQKGVWICRKQREKSLVNAG